MVVSFGMGRQPLPQLDRVLATRAAAPQWQYPRSRSVPGTQSTR